MVNQKNRASQKLILYVTCHSKNSVALKTVLKIIRNVKDAEVYFPVFKILSIRKRKGTVVLEKVT